MWLCFACRPDICTTYCFQTSCNLGVILLSKQIWEKYRSGATFPEPYCIHFPNYSKGKFTCRKDSFNTGLAVVFLFLFRHVAEQGEE